MNEEAHKTEKALNIAVLILIVALAAQGFLLYQIFQKIDDSRNQVATIRKVIQPLPVKSVTVPPPANSVTNPAPRRITPVQPRNFQSTLKPLPNLKQPGNISALNPNQQLRINPSSSGGFGMRGGDPFKEIARMQAMMEQMMSRHGGGMAMSSPSRGFRSFGSSFGGQSITTDHNNNYLITLRIPGLDKADIETRIDGNMLTVSSTSKTSRNQPGNHLVGNSQSYSQFQSSFSLPGPVQADKMAVDYKNDILTIKVPKA